MKISIILVFALLISSISWGGDPRTKANLKRGQPYLVAKKKMQKLGFKIIPTNYDLLNAVFDKNHPEIACGRIKNEMVDRELCVVTFENSKKDMINIELIKNSSGTYVLDDL